MVIMIKSTKKPPRNGFPPQDDMNFLIAVDNFSID